MSHVQFATLLNDHAQEDRQLAACNAVSKLVMAEPLPILARGLIDNLREHLDLLEVLIEDDYEVDGEW